MKTEELEQRVKKVIFDCSGTCSGVSKPEQLTGEMDLFKDLGTDSLDHVEMVMHMEEKFRIEIPDDDWYPMKTVGSIIGYIEGRMEEAEDA